MFFFDVLLHFFCSVLVRNSATLSLDSRERYFPLVHSGINSLAAMSYSSTQLKRLPCGNEAASNILQNGWVIYVIDYIFQTWLAPVGYERG